MRTYRDESFRGFLALMILVLVSATLTLPGCQQTPREQYVTAQDGFISAVAVLLDARKQGEFTEQQWQETILPWINTGNAALDEWDAATAVGAPAESALTRLREALVKLGPFILRSQHTGKTSQ